MAATVLFLALSYSEGDRVGPTITRPVDWVSHINAFGYCRGIVYRNPTGLPENEQNSWPSTQQQKDEYNQLVRDCRQQAKLENRDYSPDWANWMAWMLLVTAGLSTYLYRKERSAADATSAQAIALRRNPNRRDTPPHSTARR